MVPPVPRGAETAGLHHSANSLPEPGPNTSSPERVCAEDRLRLIRILISPLSDVAGVLRYEGRLSSIPVKKTGI